jgi:hypothetical protein
MHHDIRMMPLQSLAKILKGRADPGGGSQDYSTGPLMTSSPQIIITRFPDPEKIEKNPPEIVLSENVEISNVVVDFNCETSLADNDVSDDTMTNDENASVKIEVPRFNNQLQVKQFLSFKIAFLLFSAEVFIFCFLFSDFYWLSRIFSLIFDTTLKVACFQFLKFR